MKLEDKEEILNFFKRSIDEVLLIDATKKPYNMKIVDMPMKVWDKYKRDIVREVIQHTWLNVEINAACGGGYTENNIGLKLIGIKKSPKEFSPIKAEDMEKYIDDMLSIDRG